MNKPADASKLTDQKSLGIRFIIFFSSFIGILFLVTVINTFQHIYDITTLINARMGLPIAKRALAMIDGDAFERLATTMDPEDPYYAELQKKLYDLKVETGCLYLYTLVPYTDTVHRIVVDGSDPPGDPDLPPLGAEEPIGEYDGSYLRTWEERTTQFSKVNFLSTWGALISTFMPIFNSKGEMVGVLGCDFEATNILDTVQTSIARLAVFVVLFIGMGFLLYRSMLHTILKQNMDLTEMNQRVLAANRAKSAFLARTSHEFRTPMNAIIGMSELARREYGRPKALEYIGGIKAAGATLLAITDDILDFSKMESGRLPMTPAPYGTADLLADVLAAIRVRVEATPLELVVDASPELPSEMVGDGRRVRQVLLNLLTNAVKYTKSGFVKFSASGQPAGGQAVRLRFVVEDSGIGIRETDLPKLFDEFSRIDEKRNTGIEGTGLGLVIARSLCRAMGGDIAAESVFGRGSTFTATIEQRVADWRPMGDLAALAASLAESRRASFTAPEAEVLVVDDFSSNLLVAEGLLSPFGVRVTTCPNGRAAVELARRRPFDLVLMDHMMPEMDGVEATALIRAMGGPAGSTPIIALTANAVPGMREMFLESGFDDFLSKPIDTARLAEALLKWIPEAKRRGPADGEAAPRPAAAESYASAESAGPTKSGAPAE
jgi:signal transduction histidine kinase/FixJ family two-component response regulator